MNTEIAEKVDFITHNNSLPLNLQKTRTTRFFITQKIRTPSDEGAVAPRVTGGENTRYADSRKTRPNELKIRSGDRLNFLAG